MGCDIHLHVEVKVSGSNEWVHFASPDVGRWYRLFGKMAGVRNTDVLPISKPKGLPDDASLITKLHWNDWVPDGHCASWLDLSEIEQLEQWLKNESGAEWPHNSLDYGILHCYFKPEDYAWITDARLVFWFDN